MTETKPTRRRAGTSYDVARRAGVSQSAVSRCFREGESVSPKTRALILAAADALGYRPNAIAAVEGIDALFVGRIDLTVSLGCESPDDPKVIAAVDRIVTACVAAGRPVGMFVSRTSDVAMWREKGATLFLLGSDHGFVREGAKALRVAAGI